MKSSRYKQYSFQLISSLYLIQPIAANCENGQYLDASGFCEACPPGYACDGTNSLTECDIGEYSTGAAASCQECPIGYYCPVKALAYSAAKNDKKNP